MSATPLPLTIDIVSDVVCPWCIIGYRQLQIALARTEDLFEVSLRWHPFELNPAMPAEGEEVRAHLARKYGATRSSGNRERLVNLGRAVGFEFDYFDDMRVLNTFAAHQLLHWSRQFHLETELKLALFRAYFSERQDISDPQTLRRIASSVGLDSDAAAAALADRRYANAVRQEQQEWMDRDVMAVPAFFFDSAYPVPGAQDPDTFERVLRRIHQRKTAEAAPTL